MLGDGSVPGAGQPGALKVAVGRGGLAAVDHVAARHEEDAVQQLVHRRRWLVERQHHYAPGLRHLCAPTTDSVSQLFKPTYLVQISPCSCGYDATLLIWSTAPFPSLMLLQAHPNLKEHH